MIVRETQEPRLLRSSLFRGEPELRRVAQGQLRLGRPGDPQYPAPIRSSGSAVRRVQQALVRLGYPLRRYGIDGRYGNETYQAVLAYKRRHNIRTQSGYLDGIVGPKTVRHLDEAMLRRPKCTSGSCPIVRGEPACGVPASARVAATTAFRADEAEQEAPPGSPRPVLCLFMNAPEPSDRNFFRNQATRWAVRTRAVKEPTSALCAQVGATPFSTGLEIVQAIDNASACLSTPLLEVHIFGHSYPQGFIGAGSFNGLYRADPVVFNGLQPVNRSGGGRHVADIPVTSLASNVTFVLHGCNNAQGATNFAAALYDRLQGAGLSSARVFGHHVSVCSGQDTFWREYSARSPSGKVHLKHIPVYQGSGGCAA